MICGLTLPSDYWGLQYACHEATRLRLATTCSLSAPPPSIPLPPSALQPHRPVEEVESGGFVPPILLFAVTTSLERFNLRMGRQQKVSLV